MKAQWVTNHPAPGKAEIARLLAVEHHCPGLPEPARRSKALPQMAARRKRWAARAAVADRHR